MTTTRKRMPLSKALGDTLKTARKARGMTQYDVERLAGVSQHTVSAIETCLVASTAIANVERIARVFGMTLEELIERASPQQKAQPAAGPPPRTLFGFPVGYSIPASRMLTIAPAAAAGPSEAEQLKTIVAQLHPVLSRMDELRDLPAVRNFVGA